VGERREEAARDIEDEIAEVPEAVFDVVPPMCSKPPCRNIETKMRISSGTRRPPQKRAGMNATSKSAGSSARPSETSQKNIRTLTAISR
jgi:hypothetical protein